ncbi:hypothetical protein H5410_007111 [Solanum commersonii]|uniref:Uncharacterized protein n=1 Tax=Solanum commersonii TaxID=4109 RepID=A0A9J6AB67_SOLCO|nr:hypothetical protein H5410_007111 [Solanum commersonii]
MKNSKLVEPLNHHTGKIVRQRLRVEVNVGDEEAQTHDNNGGQGKEIVSKCEVNKVEHLFPFRLVHHHKDNKIKSRPLVQSLIETLDGDSSFWKLPQY